MLSRVIVKIVPLEGVSYLCACVNVESGEVSFEVSDEIIKPSMETLFSLELNKLMQSDNYKRLVQRVMLFSDDLPSLNKLVVMGYSKAGSYSVEIQLISRFLTMCEREFPYTELFTAAMSLRRGYVNNTARFTRLRELYNCFIYSLLYYYGLCDNPVSKVNSKFLGELVEGLRGEQLCLND